jgi:hypothetical protein
MMEDQFGEAGDNDETCDGDVSNSTYLEDEVCTVHGGRSAWWG